MTELTASVTNAVVRLTELVSSRDTWYYTDNSFAGLARMSILLPNGYTVSVIQGRTAYSGDNLFEVGVIAIDGEFTTDAFVDHNGLDEVAGWQSPAEVFEIALRAAAL